MRHRTAVSVYLFIVSRISHLSSLRHLDTTTCRRPTRRRQSGKTPKGIPASPHVVYRDEGWVGLANSGASEPTRQPQCYHAPNPCYSRSDASSIATVYASSSEYTCVSNSAITPSSPTAVSASKLDLQ